MTLVTLVYVFALVCYVSLARRVVAQGPRRALNWTCALVLLGLAVWSVEDIVHGIPSAPLSLARLFAGIGVFGWGTFASLNLVFTLVLTRRAALLRRWWLYPALVVPPVLVVCAQLSGHISRAYRLTSFGWVTVWDTCVWPYVFYVYYVSYTLLSLLLVFRFSRTAQRRQERKQAEVILHTGLVSFVLASASDIILPQLVHSRLPDLGGALVLIWAGGLYYAVTRYGLMDVTPQAAAREILATMPDALLLLAPDGSIVTSNRSAAALFGLRPEQLAGAPTDGFFADPTAFRALATRVGAGESVVSLEMECRTAAGVAVPVSVSGRAMRDRTGEVGGMVFVLRDITGRKQAEAELARAQAELVKHEKLATLDQVAGSIAHELRNPLGAVNNAVYFLKLTVGDELRGRMARHLDIIEEEVTRSNRIITSLLDYSQERYSVRGPCRLEDLVSRVLKRVQLPGSVEVETRLAADLPSIVADPGQIEQALLNIVTNSVQAMAAGGRLAIAAVRQNGTVRVTLSDSGPGIAPEHMQRLFEPLFSTKTFGVGLGLSIARAFVEASKGTITMESEVGRGTTVTVTLPVA